MQKKIKKNFFVFEINTSELFAFNFSTNKGILVIRSECVKKRTKEFSRL